MGLLDNLTELDETKKEIKLFANLMVGFTALTAVFTMMSFFRKK